jgi:hypothetical protein
MAAKVIFKFEVAHIGWESDNWVWVMEDENGKRWLESTNHGMRYKMNAQEVKEHIANYEALIECSKNGLALVDENPL